MKVYAITKDHRVIETHFGSQEMRDSIMFTFDKENAEKRAEELKDEAIQTSTIKSNLGNAYSISWKL